jgi:hypothetical protein
MNMINQTKSYTSLAVSPMGNGEGKGKLRGSGGEFGF